MDPLDDPLPEELCYLRTTPPAWAVVAGAPLVCAFGAAALALGLAGLAWERLTHRIVPEEFVGCWTNEDIDRLPPADEEA